MNNYIYLKKTDPKNSLIELNDVGFINKIGNESSDVFFIRLGTSLVVEDKFIESFDIKEVGDRYSYKICDRCFKYLDTESRFQDNRLKKNNVMTKRPSCRDCRKIKDGKSILDKDRKLFESKNKPKDFSLFTCPICKKYLLLKLVKLF